MVNEDCELWAMIGVEHDCDGEDCPFWRVVEHLDVTDARGEGCAVQYFELLEGGEEVARWLHSVRKRLLDESGLDDA